jgi:flagellar assembly factor FliW
MQTSQANLLELETVGPLQEKAIYFPEGIPAFEHVHDFVLIWNEEEAPFLWLQAKKNPDLAFIAIDPFLACPNYLPDIPDEDVELLEIEALEDIIILSIVNIKKTSSGSNMTVNLLSPIIINWKKKIAKQVILKNHLHYSVKHPITSD